MCIRDRVISSQSGHRLPALPEDQNRALALTPTERLLDLPFLAPDQVRDSLHAYQLAKRGNALRVMAEAVRWGTRGARVNTISPGIVITPLANDELNGPRGEGDRRRIAGPAVGRPRAAARIAAPGAVPLGLGCCSPRPRPSLFLLAEKPGARLASAQCLAELSLDEIWSMVDELIAAHGDWLPAYR